MNASRLARRASRSLPRPVHQWVKRRYHAVTKPLVSVVVPVYNVEPYLAECLDSLLQQTYTHLEIVVVDDGSPDDSADIARLYGRRDSRVRLVQQANTGLGGARNTGARHARGELIWFVDSDDAVPATALMTMYRSLKLSGSDFVVGSLAHWQGDKRTVPDWAARVHAQCRTGITLDDHPEVLKNVFAWTKLFRTEFFRQVIGEFPNGLYEDQAPSARAYAHGTFDVIPEVVCHWRTRADSSSITQQKTNLRDLRERWAAIEATDDALSTASPELRRAWQSKVIGFDMRQYYMAMPRAVDEYWDELHAHVVAFVERHGTAMFAGVPSVDRLLAVAAYKGYRSDVHDLVARREVMTWKVPGHVVGGHAELASSYFEGLTLAPGDLPLAIDDEVKVEPHTDAVVIGDTTVTVSGFAWLSLVDVANETPIIRVSAVDATGAVVPGATSMFVTRDADTRARDPWNSHEASGFMAVFQIDDLASDSYTFEVTVDLHGCSRSAVLRVPPTHSGGRLPVFGPHSGSTRWYAQGKSDLTLIRDVAPRVLVESVATTDTGVDLTLAEPSPQSGRIYAVAGNRTIDASWRIEARTASIEIPRELRTGSGTRWRLMWREHGGPSRMPLAWQGPSEALTKELPGPTVVDASPTGIVEFSVSSRAGVVAAFDLEADRIVVSGWATSATVAAPPSTQVALVGSRSDILAKLDTQWEGPRFFATLPLVDAAGTPWSKNTGFAVALVDGDDTHWLRTSRSLARSFPARLSNGALAVELTQTPSARATWVRFCAAYQDDERSRFAQHALMRAYTESHDDVRDTALFESFAGKSLGDSPLGISRALQEKFPDVTQLWTVDCLTRHVPEGTTPVLRYSREWFAALGTSRWLINNNNWPHFFEKKPGQTYVQTWHGTPLKRIGKDVPRENLSLTYRALMRREAREWDHLLAQSPFAAEVLPQALEYEGDTLMVGYPRNDSLVGDEAAAQRHIVRERLGVTDDYVVLYAPTWRDNWKGASGYSRVSLLDPGALKPDATGRRPTVLYRGHANTASSAPTQANDFVDVTHYADINDLMLAADALVTDYSSIMFDFAVTGKPIYLLVPDLEEYAGSVRGFYLDLDEIAPGPLCRDSAHLARELSVDFTERWGSRYRAFVERFAPLDDGDASARVVERLFSPASTSREGLSH